ncbi:MAG: hypothetical protein LBS55_01200 [Prevotellaceae bacterium]|nr:hypothetical protein [Prevotellaceae bacterium]
MLGRDTPAALFVFENVGGFIPDSVEEAIKFDSPQHYYRNPFLAEAMVNLNMIDTIGSGIKKMFIKQKGSATREEIEALIMPTLSFDMSKDKKQRKISNITAKIAKDGKIKNQSASTKSSVWVLTK